MPKVYHVKKSRKRYRREGIKKGQEYWWWTKRSMQGGRFGKSVVIRSPRAPKPSQLVSSPFLKQVYELREYLNELVLYTIDDLTDCVNSLAEDVRILKLDCETSFEAIPESLKENSPNARVLQERIDALENWIARIEAIDFDTDGEQTASDLSGILDAVRNTFPDEF